MNRPEDAGSDDFSVSFLVVPGWEAILLSFFHQMKGLE